MALLVAASLFGPAPARAAAPVYSAGGQSFQTWRDYYGSSYFEENGKRCGKPKSIAPPSFAPSDCSFTSTNPSSDYDTVDIYEIQVVVHIIENTSGQGQISDALVHSQIDILNEDFRALVGTPGAPGFDTGIQFVLATTDPQGNPTTGITRSVNNTWFNDGGSYWNSLAWDTARYMNVYTNLAGGNLGYVPNLPQGGLAGQASDRVVVLWSAFGRDSQGGPPYDQGRTLTHEVGHYLGLEHTFNGGCAAASAPGCYSSGDLICDTNSEQQPNYGCPGGGSTSCGTSDPIENYMDYSDDTCMDRFSDEQSHRMRCSLLHYRSDLYAVVNPGVCGNDVIESGEECDGTDPGACPTGVCDPDCTCEDPVCGNDLIEAGEECDGTALGACPTGVCDPDCTCEDPVCGNDVLEAGEECDGTDDAACPGECDGSCACPSSCGDGTCEPSEGENASTCAADCGCAAPGACNDEAPDGCWCDDQCLQFGDCCPDVCDACALHCPATAGCAATPMTPCRDTAALGAVLTLKNDPNNDAKDKLVFKIKRGDATTIGDFLDPLSLGKTASVCLYDSSGATQPLLAAAVPSGGTCGSKDCWRAAGVTGYKYVDKAASSDGVFSIKLKGGADGKAQVQAKAKGAELNPPALPLAFPLTVQFLIEDGATTNCWQSQLTLPLRNDATVVKGKGP